MLKLKCLSCGHTYEVNAELVGTPNKIGRPLGSKTKKVAKKSYYQRKKAREYARTWYQRNKQKKLSKKPAIVLKRGELGADYPATF